MILCVNAHAHRYLGAWRAEAHTQDSERGKVRCWAAALFRQAGIPQPLQTVILILLL